MKSYVWTYVEGKPKVFELDRYYLIKNKRQLNKLIDKLLDIDATTIPGELRFPVLLELESGFAPTLVEASLPAIRDDVKKLQKLIKEAK